MQDGHPGLLLLSKPALRDLGAGGRWVATRWLLCLSFLALGSPLPTLEADIRLGDVLLPRTNAWVLPLALPLQTSGARALQSGGCQVGERVGRRVGPIDAASVLGRSTFRCSVPTRLASSMGSARTGSPRELRGAGGARGKFAPRMGEMDLGDTVENWDNLDDGYSRSVYEEISSELQPWGDSGVARAHEHARQLGPATRLRAPRRGRPRRGRPRL